MAKKKALAPDFVAVVRVKYGNGRKAVTIDVPTDITFENVYAYTVQSGAQNASDHAIGNVDNMSKTFKIVNKKELTAAFKQWKKAPR